MILGLMIRGLISVFVLFGGVQFTYAGKLESTIASQKPAEPMNCVNAGGGCNGTVPCCQDSYCVRNRCQPVPENNSPVKILMPQDVSKVCAL